MADLVPKPVPGISDRLAFQGDSGFSVWKLSTDRENRSGRNVRSLLGSQPLKEEKALNLTLFASRAANNDAARPLDEFRQRFGDLRAMYMESLERKDRLRGSISGRVGGNSLPLERLAISPNHPRQKASSTLSSDRSALPLVRPSTPFGESSIIGELSGCPVQSRHELSLSPTATEGTFRRPDVTEATTNRSHHSASISTGSSGENTSVFADLDQRIARSMHADPFLGSAEATIRTLHSLPGGPRALVYGFDSGLGRVDGENAARPFRCPFDIVHPQAERSPSCKEPILYSPVQLWYVQLQVR